MKSTIFVLWVFLVTGMGAQTTTIPKNKGLRVIPKEVPSKDNKNYSLSTEKLSDAKMESTVAKNPWFLFPNMVTSVDGTEIKTIIYPLNAVEENQIIDLKPKPRNTGTTDDNGLICKSYSVSLSPGAESFDAPLADKMAFTYPGAAYNYNEYIKNNVQPSHNKSERNHIILQVSSASGTGKQILVEDPTKNNLDEAVGELKAALPQQAYNLSTEIYVQTIVNNASFALNVEAGGGGFGFRAYAKLGIGYDKRKTYMSIDAKQKNYVITANRPDRAVGGFYKDSLENTTNENVYMSSVTYGRRVIGVIETELDEEHKDIGFQASFNGFGPSANLGLEIIDRMSSSKTSVRLIYIGGKGNVIDIPNPTAESVLTTINKWMTDSDAQSAVPVEYTFRNMQDIGMRWESVANNINYEQCIPKPKEPQPWDVSVTLNSISNSKQEEVKLGIQQSIEVLTSGGAKVENSGKNQPIICWMEGWEGCQPPPIIDFRSPYSNVRKSYHYTVSNEEYEENPVLRINTKRIVMYATNFGGSKNDNNNVQNYDISLKEIGGSSTFEVPVHVNGRIFNFSYTVNVRPQPSSKLIK